MVICKICICIYYFYLHLHLFLFTYIILGFYDTDTKWFYSDDLHIPKYTLIIMQHHNFEFIVFHTVCRPISLRSSITHTLVIRCLNINQLQLHHTSPVNLTIICSGKNNVYVAETWDQLCWLDGLIRGIHYHGNVQVLELIYTLPLDQLFLKPGPVLKWPTYPTAFMCRKDIIPSGFQ